MKLTILGGSSPFTASLFYQDALAANSLLEVFDSIVLYGRSESALQHVKSHGNRLLCNRAERVRYELDLKAAIEGSDVILVQVRFGGTDSRQEIDRICESHNLFSDETLGCGGLGTALKFHSEWEALGQLLWKYSPNAIVLNMINPLSLSSLKLSSYGSRVIGLCEGPVETVHGICEILKCSSNALTWQYTGLNHRGFVHSIQLAGEAVALDRIFRGQNVSPADRFRSQFSSFLSKEFCNAIDRSRWTFGRARTVLGARERLSEALENSEVLSLSDMLARPTPWYSSAVLPFIGAWTSQTEECLLTTNHLDGGVFIESRTTVKAGKLIFSEDPSPNEEAEELLLQIMNHEKKSIEAITLNTHESICGAVASDPSISEDDFDRAVKCIEEICGAQ